MTKIQRTRLLIDIAGIAIALGTIFALQNFWLGMIAAAVILGLSRWLADRATAAIAADDENKSEDHQSSGS